MNKGLIGLVVATSFMLQGCKDDSCSGSLNDAEPNDSIAEANTLGIPATIRGTVHEFNDWHDVFEIIPEDSAQYGFELTGQQGADVDLYLELSDGTELDSSTNLSSNESIIRSLTTGVSYYLIVDAFDTSGSSTCYSLTTYKVQ